MTNDLAIASALEAISRRAKGGVLTPQAVVEAARDPRSPLHDRFTWDDSEAANKQRLHEARTLIRSVKVVITTNRVQVKAPVYVRDPQASAKEQGYLKLQTLKRKKDLAYEAALAEFRRADSCLERAQAITFAVGLGGDIEDLRAGLSALVKKFSDKSARD